MSRPLIRARSRLPVGAIPVEFDIECFDDIETLYHFSHLEHAWITVFENDRAVFRRINAIRTGADQAK